MKSNIIREKLHQVQQNLAALQGSTTIHAVGIHTDNAQFYYSPKQNQDISGVKDMLVQMMEEDMQLYVNELSNAELIEQDEAKQSVKVQKDKEEQREKEEFDILVQHELKRLRAASVAQELFSKEKNK